jgi:hypothetical protein
MKDELAQAESIPEYGKEAYEKPDKFAAALHNVETVISEQADLLRGCDINDPKTFGLKEVLFELNQRVASKEKPLDSGQAQELFDFVASYQGTKNSDSVKEHLILALNEYLNSILKRKALAPKQEVKDDLSGMNQEGVNQLKKWFAQILQSQYAESDNAHITRAIAGVLRKIVELTGDNALDESYREYFKKLNEQNYYTRNEKMLFIEHKNLLADFFNKLNNKLTIIGGKNLEKFDFFKENALRNANEALSIIVNLHKENDLNGDYDALKERLAEGLKDILDTAYNNYAKEIGKDELNQAIREIIEEGVVDGKIAAMLQELITELKE